MLPRGRSLGIGMCLYRSSHRHGAMLLCLSGVVCEQVAHRGSVSVWVRGLGGGLGTWLLAVRPIKRASFVL